MSLLLLLRLVNCYCYYDCYRGYFYNYHYYYSYSSSYCFGDCCTVVTETITTTFTITGAVSNTFARSISIPPAAPDTTDTAIVTAASLLVRSTGILANTHRSGG